MPKESGKDVSRAVAVSPACRIETIRKEVASLSNEELRKELVDRLCISVEHLVRVAALVAELESRGENLRGLRIGLLPYLRQIAAGKLVPEIVVKFAGSPNSIRAIGNLPVTEQLKIARGEREYQPTVPKTPASVQTRYKSRPNVFNKDEDDDDDDITSITPITTKQEKEQAMKNIASKGSPRDVAEMVWNLIGCSNERPMVLQHLFRLLVESGVVHGELAKQMRSYTGKSVSAVSFD